MLRGIKVLFLAVSVLVLSVAGASAAQDTLTYGLSSTLKTLDPHKTTDPTAHNVMNQMYETLILVADDGKISPMLAEKWETLENGQAFKFYLKKNVKFHNGDTMTADDVIFTFKRATSDQAGAVKSYSMYLDPNSLEKIDDHTVLMKTKIPMPVFLKTLGHMWAAILNKNTVEKYGKDYDRYAVGTGAFQLKEWIYGDRVILERFEEYHGDKAPLKQFIVRTVIEATSRSIELEKGSLDVIEFPLQTDVPRFERNPKLAVFKTPSTRTYQVYIDVTKPPYNDVRVRKAMHLAADRAGIAKATFRGYAVPSRGPVPPTVMPAKFDASPEFKRDIEQAKALIKEALPNGFKGRLVTADRTDYKSITEILQANYKEIGLDMEIQVVEWGALLEEMRTKGHDPAITIWWGGPPVIDPFIMITPQFHTSAIGSTNRSFYSNPKMDALLDKGASLPDGAERDAVYNDVWDMLNEELPIIPLVCSYNLLGIKKAMKGAGLGARTVCYFNKAYFTE